MIRTGYSSMNFRKYLCNDYTCHPVLIQSLFKFLRMTKSSPLFYEERYSKVLKYS